MGKKFIKKKKKRKRYIRKPLKKDVRINRKLTIKLICALRLNAEVSLKNKKKQKKQKKNTSLCLCFGSGALSKFFPLKLFCRPLFLDLVFALYQLLWMEPGLFPSFPRQPLLGLGLWSSPFDCSHRHKMLFPKPGTGFQDYCINPGCRSKERLVHIGS